MRRGLAAALFALWPLAAGWAQPAARPVEIAGQVEQPASYSIEALAALPAFEVAATRENGMPTSYVGPLLWPILAAARIVDGPAHRTHLQHVLFARGADDYVVAVAIGEVDPGFEGKPVIVAYKQDGKLLAQPRLVVPGDKKLGRSVRDLVAVEVR